MRASVVAGVAVLAAVPLACGRDFKPKESAPTGEPAAPLGQVVDVEVSLPNLQIAGAIGRGVQLDLVLEADDAVAGRHEARYRPGRARFGMGGAAEVEDLGDGRTSLTISDDVWTTGRLGPLRIETTVFELLLDGEPRDGGFRVAGASWESQTALRGTFEGWRRHRFLVAATDFFAAGRVVEVAWVKGREIRVRGDLERVSADPVLRRTGRGVFAVNRLSFDDVQRLDPDRDFATSWQTGAGTGANPHDIAVVAQDKAYVTRYEPPFDDLLVVDPRGGIIRGSVPLDGLADNPDATPRPDRMAVSDGTVFVGLQDIDRTFTRFGEGKLAVVDPSLDEVVGVVPLGGKNPGDLEPVRGLDGRQRLFVSLGGIFPGLQARELSGGVVVVDVAQRVVERVALDDDDAGGNLGALAMAGAGVGYVVVSDESFVNRVVAFDPSGAGVLRVVWETGEFVPELEVDSGGILAVPDRSFSRPRLCLWSVPADAAGLETPLACADLALPPVSLEALD